MGFATRAEYTVRFLRDPSKHDQLARRFVATVFVLATDFDEVAMAFLLRHWREIDQITSNRIRFLFFIDNEVTLTGYPAKPRFTQDGYSRHHADLLRAARQSGFEMSVQREQEVFLDPVRNRDPRWHPQQAVRRLGQQLGLVGRFPCLVWHLDTSPDAIYVRSLKSLSADDVFSVLREVCNSFYDTNADVLSSIDRLEGRADEVCRGALITVDALRRTQSLVSLYERVHDVLGRFQFATLRDASLSEQALHLRDLAGALSQIGPGVTREVPSRTLEWAKRLPRLVSFVRDATKEDASIDWKVPHVAAALQSLMYLGNTLPTDSPRLVVESQLSLSHEVFDEIKQLLEDAAGEGEAGERCKRFLAYLEAQRNNDVLEFWATPAAQVATGSKPQEEPPNADIVAWVNALKVAQEATLRGPQVSITRWRRVRATLSHMLSDQLERSGHASGMSVFFWIYNQAHRFCLACRSQIEHEVDSARQEESGQADRVAELNAVSVEIEESLGKLQWPGLNKFDMLPAPASLYTSLDLKADRGTTAGLPVYAREMDRMRSVLVPIAEAMSALDITAGERPSDVSTAHLLRIASDTSGVVVLNGSGSVYTGDFKVTGRHDESINIDFGHGNTFTGDVGIGRHIERSFTKAQRAPDDHVRQHLKELSRLVAKLAERSPEPRAEEAARDLETVVAEATSDRPRRRWYELGAEGLIDAAKAVDGMAEPIASVLKKLSEMLSF